MDIDPRPKLHRLKQRLAALRDELLKLIELNTDKKTYEAKETEFEAVGVQIARLEKTLDLGRNHAELVRDGSLVGNDGFKNIGDQLQAIRRACNDPRTTDERLIRAPSGLGETDPSGGGFAIAPEFISTILTRVYDLGEILKRTFQLPIEGPSVKIPGIDETSRATGSRWGGVQSYWVGEGDAATATKPKFRLIELAPKKLMSIWYVTDELLADSVALTAIANEAFAEEIMFMLEDGIFEGSGAGMPLGIMSAKPLITVPAEKGQASKTLVYANIANMWQRMWARSRKNACWFINQDTEGQLYQLSSVVGTGGQPVFLPAGPVGSQASGAPFATLYGRQIIPVEYAQTLGTVGDIVLADFSQYVLAMRGPMQQMTSIHVRFLYDETTFRLTYRADGQPIWPDVLTPFHGTNTVAPFVALASR